MTPTCTARPFGAFFHGEFEDNFDDDKQNNKFRERHLWPLFNPKTKIAPQEARIECKTLKQIGSCLPLFSVISVRKVRNARIECCKRRDFCGNNRPQTRMVKPFRRGTSGIRRKKIPCCTPQFWITADANYHWRTFLDAHGISAPERRNPRSFLRRRGFLSTQSRRIEDCLGADKL